MHKRFSLPILCFIVLAGLGLKTWIQLSGSLPFNSDEAIVGLMARHILINGEKPIFFYGQSYMGSLDAYLVAIGFTVLGQYVWVIRLVQSLLYVGTLLTTYALGTNLFGSPKTGLIATALMAVPVVNLSLYSTVSIGGYGEALLIGNLILLVTLAIRRNIKRDNIVGPDKTRFYFYIAAWAFLAGLGLWVNGLTLVFSAPTGLFIVWELWLRRQTISRRDWFILFFLVVVGFGLGAAPWWIYAAQNGFQGLIDELLGQAVAVEQGSWFLRTSNHILYFLLFGLTVILGIRPPWDIKWLALPLIPVILVLWCGIIYSVILKVRKGSAERVNYLLLLSIIGCDAAGFILTPFGIDPSGRYFLPFAVPLALLGAERLCTLGEKRRQISTAFVLIILLFNFIGTLQCVIQNPPGITTQFDLTTAIDHKFDGQLIQFLLDQGEIRGYSNYWVAYPIAFLSDERIIVIPELPYHLDFRYTSRDDRYKVYDSLVDESEKVAYITTNFAELDSRLRQEFNRLGITWQEKTIGDYQIFYNISRKITPEETNLQLVR